VIWSDSLGTIVTAALPASADGPTVDFTVVMYEAGPGLVFSIDEDIRSEWLGTFQRQNAGPLKAIYVKIGPWLKAKRNRNHSQSCSLRSGRNSYLLPESSPHRHSSAILDNRVLQVYTRHTLYRKVQCNSGSGYEHAV
jgi:hypothetical protein